MADKISKKPELKDTTGDKIIWEEAADAEHLKGEHVAKGAAVISEIAVWTTAAILGLSVIESRKRIWARIRAPFGQR